MTPEFSERCLILAPQGRDATVAAAMLAESAITSDICASIGALVEALREGAGFCIVTEEALRQADLRPLMAFLDAQPEWSDFPFILLTKKGGGVERNPAAGRFLQVLGNVSFLERPFHPTTLLSMSQSALRGRRRQYEARTRLLDLRERGERLSEVNETLEKRVRERTSALEDAYQKVIEESTQRAHAEEQLRQVQKLEIIGQLTGGVAHDFNNLLTAVLGNLSILQRHLPASDSRGQRFVEGAIQGARRGAALTQRLLAFARRQSLQIVPTDIVGLVREMRGLLERSVGPEIALSFDLSADPVVAMIDANQVELAILNLAVNARDAMPHGGELSIGVDLMEISDDLPAGTYARIKVSDTGSGMDEATLRRAIDPFFSTKELGKGTGLGLSMVHGLATQLRGALKLQSTPGQGTEAELYFPATQQVAESREEPALVSAPKARRWRILLVDDDALIAMSSVDMLADLGHEVFEAHSGNEALDFLHSHEPVDLLVTDFAMPEMTGAQLITAVRKTYPALPVLLATGYADVPGEALNGVPRIGKPYTQAQLADAIARLLEMQQACDVA